MACVTAWAKRRSDLHLQLEFPYIGIAHSHLGLHCCVKVKTEILYRVGRLDRSIGDLDHALGRQQRQTTETDQQICIGEQLVTGAGSRMFQQHFGGKQAKFQLVSMRRRPNPYRGI